MIMIVAIVIGVLMVIALGIWIKDIAKISKHLNNNDDIFKDLDPKAVKEIKLKAKTKEKNRRAIAKSNGKGWKGPNKNYW